MSNKNEQIAKDLINKMFEIAGHKVVFEDIANRQDEWYWQWTMTEEQNKEWRSWGVSYLRKKKRWRKPFAETQMAFFDLAYGLKIDK